MKILNIFDHSRSRQHRLIQYQVRYDQSNQHCLQWPTKAFQNCRQLFQLLLFYMEIKLEPFRPITKSIMSIFITWPRSWLWKSRYLLDGTKSMQKTHSVWYGRGQDFCSPDLITVIALIFTTAFLPLWKIIIYSYPVWLGINP